MKRSFFLLLIPVVFAAGCSTDSTIDATSVASADNNSDSGTSDSGSSDSGSSDSGSSDSGSSDSGSSDSGSSDSGSTESQEDGVTPEPPPATAEPVEPASGNFGSDDWCTVALHVENQFDELDLVDFGDPEALEAAYTGALALIRQSQQFAPPEIAGDVATAVSGLEFFAQELAAADWSFLDVDLSALDALDDQQEAASFAIDKYNFEVCGIDNGFDLDDDPSLQPESSDDFDLPVEGTIRDQAIAGFLESGFTEEEANCLLDKLDITNPEAFADTTALLDLFGECGISLERLGSLGG